MSAQEIIARLTAALQKLEQGQAKMTAAAQDFAEARALVAGALQGGSSAPLIALVDRAREAVAAAAQHTEPAKQRVTETIQKAQALGNL